MHYIGANRAPLGPRERAEIVYVITSHIAFHQAGQFRDDLAEKMIYTKLALAKLGVPTGGLPPYGFCRALHAPDQTIVRVLADREVVRKTGHHVVWSPDAGRKRCDRGIEHAMSGVWHANSVTNIARNRLLSGVMEFGRRSMGDARSMTQDGPRHLTDDDLNVSGKPTVVRNAKGKIISAPSAAGGAPTFDPVRQDALIARLDERGKSQRGKPRSRDVANNPLGGRISDMDCCWPMYRVPHGQSYRYTCGKYQQSHGAKCTHNHVDGKIATLFALAALRQKLLNLRTFVVCS